VKPRLLVIELWGVGDLVIATPFLRKASEQFDVTLLAKPYAADLRARFWPDVRVIPFNAPWTAFARKYHLTAWPWRVMFRSWKALYRERFDVGLSARWDPRDHFLLRLTGARTRLGFPRTGSRMFLTHPIQPADPAEHRYENWRIIARSLNLELELRSQIKFPPPPQKPTILLHTGAAQPVRVWPLERYQSLVRRLRARGLDVKVVCNPEQRDWWLGAGETGVAAPETIAELLALLDESGLFLGNDSGPGHLASLCGIPTFSVFGPQLPGWFVPFHPAAEFIEGKPCPFKPCSDYCRFPEPQCLWNITEPDVWPRLEKFIGRNLPKSVF
jgi:ADP-heptose:LPS heptosyltransferase